MLRTCVTSLEGEGYMPEIVQLLPDSTCEVRWTPRTFAVHIMHSCKLSVAYCTCNFG
jgi:hypothetical protein